MPLLANSDLVMSLVDNQMGDTQLYPDGPGATLETPKKTTVEGDAGEAAETQKVPDTPALAEAVSDAEDASVVAAEPSADPASKESVAKPAAASGADAAPSGAATEQDLEALPIERFDWCTLTKLPSNYCANCRRPVEASPGQRVQKKQHCKLMCKLCHNATTMLYKRLDMQSTGFRELPPHQALRWVKWSASS